MNRSIMKSIFKGVRIGHNKSMLPSKVEQFINKPIIRAMRVIGGISALMAIKGKDILSYLPLEILIYTLGLIQICQMIVVCMIKLVYGFKILRDKKEFEIRNSPYDKWASIAGKAWYCFKYGCQTSVVGMGVLSGAEVIDNILVKAGKNEILTPLIVDRINRFDKIMGKEVPINVNGGISKWEKDILYHSNKLKECRLGVDRIEEGKNIIGAILKEGNLGKMEEAILKENQDKIKGDLKDMIKYHITQIDSKTKELREIMGKDK